jgi:hypothetical protein
LIKSDVINKSVNFGYSNLDLTYCDPIGVLATKTQSVESKRKEELALCPVK